MNDKAYKRELWIYSVLVVVASFFAFGTSVLSALITLDSTLAWILPIASVVLFLFATAKFGVYLKLNSRQWLIAIVLLLLAWVGSVIYLVTRKPNA
ncbi:MAG: hypothetical protein JXA49_08265 [Actinobacteria bacterium]|nr:hypothetical protein [Actinomycetota bacterium]